MPLTYYLFFLFPSVFKGSNYSLAMEPLYIVLKKIERFL